MVEGCFKYSVLFVNLRVYSWGLFIYGVHLKADRGNTFFYKSGNIYGFMSGDFCGISWHLYLIIGFKNSGKQFNSVGSEDEYVD